MKRIITRHVLAAVLAGAVALPAVAEQVKPSVAENIRGDRHAPPPHNGKSGLRLADRLSTLETYIGITPEQAPAWRAYANAMQAFAEPPRPMRGTHPRDGVDMPSPQGENQDPARRQAQPPQMLLGERMAEHALAKGRRAEGLKSAAATLRAELSPEQLTRLIGAETPPMGTQSGGPARAHALPRPGE